MYVIKCVFVCVCLIELFENKMLCMLLNVFVCLCLVETFENNILHSRRKFATINALHP